MSRSAPAAPLRLTLPKQPSRFRLTEDDLAILYFVASKRFARTDQIARAVGRSLAKTRMRLRLLWENGYLHRPLQQSVYATAFTDEGNRPLIYSAKHKTLRALQEHGAPVDPMLAAAVNNNRRAATPFLDHHLAVTEFMLGFRITEGTRPQLIDHAELLNVPGLIPEATRAARDPFCLTVSFEHDRVPLTLRIRSDRLFGLHSDDGVRFYGLELDRGSETIRPRGKPLPAKSSIERKILGYFHASKQGIYEQRWGFSAFRVLVVVPSEVRLENMITAQRALTGDTRAGLFLYTTTDRLAAGGPLAPVWRSATADNIALLTS